MNNDKKLFLASVSPRRVDLLHQIGLSPIVIPADIKEMKDGFPPEELVVKNACAKAEYVGSQLEEGLVLAADTLVVKDNAILGKPHDAEDAFRILSALNNTWHWVYTGVTVYDVKSRVCRFDLEKSQVLFADLTEAEIWDYIATGEPMDKAGAYGIQALGGIFIKEIRGDYSNIVGLPLYKTNQLLKSFGFKIL